jgi:putative tryptophan/tyrosine transport system substrate-binding protein
MKRREFLTVLGGAATIPLAARAQEKVRRVGVLMNVTSDDPEAQQYVAAFQQGLQALGWIVGRNLRIDQRWALGEAGRYRQAAVELVALGPDVILAAGAGVLAVRQVDPKVPVVFPQALDPVGSGFVASLSRPGGTATGFMQFEFSLAGKWLQLLMEAAPGVTRVGLLREAANPAGIGQWAALQVAAEPTGLELSPLSIRDAGEIERGITAFAREPNSGLIVGVGGGTVVHRRAIIDSAARNRLPAVYPYKFIATEGGLMSYGVDLVEQYRRAASYVDRILRGEKPADLPVQKPTKYYLIANLKTAKALGITMPSSLLARADEVIE